VKAGRLERWAWILGALLLLVWGGARLHSVLGAKRELRRFEAARRHATAATAPTPAPAPTAPLVPPAALAPTAAPSGLPAPLQGPEPPCLLDEPAVADFQLWSPKRIRAYEESREAQNRGPLAVLRIPAIGLEVAVLEGTDDLTLNRGVGWIAGTALPGESGNLGIAGHRDGFFRGLKDVMRGVPLELETLGGARLLYTVQDIWIVRPDAVEVLDPTPRPSLTLVTCFPFYYVGSAPERYIVRAVLDGAPEPVAP
jgi:LPXTG-site transpeptidase (sortase) family protein